MNKKIYVGNLPISFNSEDLELLFRNYGNIVSAKVFSYPGGINFGKYGFVEMISEMDAANAVVNLNSFYLTGKRIIVTHLVQK